MGKILVLAEKPSVGREIARVIGCKKTSGSAIYGDKYIVTWASGHLVTLADPEHYGNEYKTWSMETLPMLPKKMDLEVIKQTGKQFSAVRRLLLSDDVSEIVIATDAGREGELVARWIIMKAGCKKPIKRLWISSQTDKAIKDGFAHLEDGKKYDNLYFSAQARAEADWYVGLNATRALTCKFNASLSAGRVQTPTLAMIVKREEEIRSFVPKQYYEINAYFKGFTAILQNKSGKLFDKEKAEEIYTKIKNGKFKVSEIKKTVKKEAAPLLYDLTELQRDANKIYGYSAKQTLNIMQCLYEQRKLLTYPRTDSRYITTDIVPTLSERLKSAAVGENSKIVSDIIKNRRQISKVCVNNDKVSDHHAIIPTEENFGLSELTPEELRIYKLVVKRFLECFYPPYEYENIKAVLTCSGETFTANGKNVINPGWKTVFGEIDRDVNSFPSVNTELIADKTEIKSLKTAPPSRYTEATLLSAMENPSEFIDDDKMRKIIKNSSGLGTPATRADIIEKLFDCFYVERRGKEIYPTSKGKQLISLVPTDLKEPVLTAKWEEILENISRGKADKSEFIKEIKDYASTLVRDIKYSNSNYIHDNMTHTPCPQCGKYLLDVKGKRGKMLVCSDRECGYRENLSFKTNVRCPNCHKKMDLYGEGENKKYICTCGFKEKLTAFNKRFENTGSASKRDVMKYMKNQNTSNEISPFELAMQKAMKK